MLIQVICPACKTEIPDGSTFCLSCGRPVKAEGMDMILPPDGSRTEERATIYMILAIMFLFFGIFLLIPGFFVGLGLIIPAIGLIVLGVVFVLARYAVLKRYSRRVEDLRKESAIRVRCTYCGKFNRQEDEKCASCGAPLV